MKNQLSLMIAVLLLIGLWGDPSDAFDIQYPGEAGFFIGKSMAYVIQETGEEGIFIFGQDRVTIGGGEYYDCIFDYPGNTAHFYLGLDPAKGFLFQKGFEVGQSELDIEPAVTAVRYPLSPGSSWSEKGIKLTAKNIELPGFGVLPEISVTGATSKTIVSSEIIFVQAGTFDALLVESTYSGSLLGIPVSVVQRTWLNRDNITLKRNFEFVVFSNVLPIYEMELSKITLTPWDVNWDGLVDLVDLMMVARHYGEQMPEPRAYSPDVNGDGSVGIHDLAMVGAYFGRNTDLEAPAKHIAISDYFVHPDVLRIVCQEAEQQSYQLSGDDLAGLKRALRTLELALAEPPRPSIQNVLLQSFPNPCNPEAWIPYSLAVDSPVTIGIYSISGQLVRELALGRKPAGIYTSRDTAAYWDGRNSTGEKAASGVYIYTIRAGDFTATRRMLLLK